MIDQRVHVAQPAPPKAHPWLNLGPHGAIIGRATDAGRCQLVTSERKVWDPEQPEIRDALAFRPRVYPDLAGRWPDADAHDWLATGKAPTFSEVLALLIYELQATVEFPRKEHAALVATWAVAGYFHPLFLSFPRLQLVGERGSGKSKLLALLHATAWNASLMVAPTPAVLYRLVQETRPTMLLDECEALDKDDRKEIFAVVNSGYKQGASVPRCEGDRTKRVEFYEVYAPMALASIRGLNATTEDRAITMVMQRGIDQRKVNAELDPRAPRFTRVRSGCYRLLLTRYVDVVKTCQTIELAQWLNARARELWKPLLVIAAIADAENGLSLTPDLLALAREHVEDGNPLSTEGAALLAEVGDLLGGAESATVRPGALAESIGKRLGWRDAPTAEQIGGWLRRLGFRRTGRDRDGACYTITPEGFRTVADRFNLPDDRHTGTDT
jgi:hypothetical protein